MNSYHMNFAPVPQASGCKYVQTAQSIDRDSCVPPSLHGSTLEYFPTASHQSYPLPGHDGHGLSPVPRISKANVTRSLHTSVGSGSIRTPSLSSHPYHQARLRHIADRASAQHQGCSQLSLPAVPVPASGAVPSYNMLLDNHASTRCHDSSQLPLIATKTTPVGAFDSASQPDIVAANTNQPFMSNAMVPGQMFLSSYQKPASPPSYAPADAADIEYAQYRYGDKRCFYQCRFDLPGSPCNRWIVGDRTRVLRHLRNHHHLQIGPAAPALCRWDKCTHSRPMKQENLSRHIVMHLGVKWKCPHCRRLFSRDDAVHRHVERMVPGMDVTDAEVVPGYEARAINELQCRRA